MILIFLFGCIATRAVGENIIPECGVETVLKKKVPAEERINLEQGGQLMPFGITLISWDSANILCRIVFYVATEILGINTRFSAAATTSSGVIETLIETTNHVGVELWALLYLSEIDRIVTDSGYNAPRMVGQMHYTGLEGTFVSIADQSKALAANPTVHLEYYKCYSPSVYEPFRYFSHIAEIPSASMANCSSSKLWNTDLAEVYRKHTGDDGGVEVLNGELKYKCMGGASGVWWLSPSCREHPHQCIPWITGLSYSIDMCAQQAVAYNMPVACGNAATWSLYTIIAKNYSTLFYWWVPDMTFVGYATQLSFPPHDRLEWLDQNKKTQSTAIPLETWVNRNLSRMSPHMEYFLSNMALTRKEMDGMLVKISDPASSVSPGDAMSKNQAACQWLKHNKPTWEPWIKDVTSCELGEGLVDASGNNVRTREEALGCALCSSGYSSVRIFDNRGGTYSCSQCNVGHAQKNPGQSECVACAPGKFASKSGRSMCQECAIGKFQSLSGGLTCTSCGPKQTTLQLMSVNGQNQYILFSGASASSDCGCEPGSRPENGECVECVQGLDCKGKEEILVRMGFSAGEDLSVYKCHGDRLRCPGGRPGNSCATGRLGKSCAECESKKTPHSSGTCESCHGSHKAFFIVAVVFCLLALGLVYWVVATKDHTKQSHAILLCALVSSIAITIVQQFGVLDIVSLEWPEPLSFLLDVLRLSNLNIESLRFGCVASFSPLARFTTKISLMAFGVILITIIHAGFVCCFRNGDFKGNTMALIGTLGTLFMVFYISVVSIVVAPLQCLENPNQQLTVRDYQSVECWSSEVDHTIMVVLGLLALLIPLGYLAECARAVMTFPREMRAGNANFLKSYAFLFFRYRVQAYWYSIPHMLRSLFISLAPLTTNVVVQIFILQLTTMMHLVLTAIFLPWRVRLCNILDGCFSCGFLLVTTLGAIFVEDSDTKSLAWVGIAVIIALLASVPCLLLHGLRLHIHRRSTKDFEFFICHHKAATGCFARLVKIALVASPRVSKKVFIDTDDLADLDQLFEYVGSQLENLIVICSREVLLRQWCMGEIVTAKHCNVNTVRILLEDYVEPDIAFIDSYAINVDLSALAEHGIHSSMVRDTLKWFPNQARIMFPKYISEATLNSLIFTLIKAYRRSWFSGRSSSELVYQPDKKNLDGLNAILVDHSRFEAQAAAIVLKSYLTKHTSHRPDQIPFILPDGGAAPATTVIILIICSQDAFMQAQLLRSLMSTAKLEVRSLPILADESFRFPTPHFLDETTVILDFTVDERPELVRMILDVFRSIAVPFFPQQHSHTDLDAKAAQIFLRIEEKEAYVTQLSTAIRNRSVASNKFSSRSYEDTGSVAILAVSSPIPERRQFEL